MTTSPPKLIYFDLGNVLLHFDHEIACHQMAQVSGLPPEKVREVVFGEDGLEWKYESGAVTSQQFYDIFCEKTGAKPAYATLLRAGSDIFTLNVSIVPLVAQLRASGHRLGVLSNTCEAHWQFVTDGRYAILPGYFDVIALSYELGAMKPEATVFQRAAELAGVTPEEIFYMDDRPENVAAAREAGFDAVEYTTTASLVGDLRRRGVRFNY